MDYRTERQNLIEKITSLTLGDDWESLAIRLFHYQYRYNVHYRKYVDLLRINPNAIISVNQIPSMPIELFKSNVIKTGSWKAEQIFMSSGTSGQQRSMHPVKEMKLYEYVAEVCFEKALGSLSNSTIIAVLPSYLENPNSSLLYMVNHFIQKTESNISGYYNIDKKEIESAIAKSFKKDKTPVIFGVSYALLDLAEQNADLSNASIIETGGMKGRRKEMLKSDLHAKLIEHFHVDEICSEYGMAELMSQAYAVRDGIFKNSTYLKVRCKELNDPFTLEKQGKVGVIECIDLANIDSCCFIQTQDLGKMTDSDHFQILGRLQESDLRGCNLMYDQISH